MGSGTSDGPPILGTSQTLPTSNADRLKTIEGIGVIAFIAAFATYAVGYTIQHRVGEPSFPVMATILFILFGSISVVLASIASYALVRYQIYVRAKISKTSR